MNTLTKNIAYGALLAATYLVAPGCNQKQPQALPSYSDIKVESYMKHETNTKNNPFALENNLDPPTKGIILQGKVRKVVDDQ